jgi:hypothetical protein
MCGHQTRPKCPVVHVHTIGLPVSYPVMDNNWTTSSTSIIQWIGIQYVRPSNVLLCLSNRVDCILFSGRFQTTRSSRTLDDGRTDGQTDRLTSPPRARPPDEVLVHVPLAAGEVGRRLRRVLLAVFGVEHRADGLQLRDVLHAQTLNPKT